MNSDPRFPTEPCWWCDHCDRLASGISDAADPNETQSCHQCHKATVTWLTDEDLARRAATLYAACPTPTIKTEQHETAVIGTPHAKRIRSLAPEWFAKMRAAINQTNTPTP